MMKHVWVAGLLAIGCDSAPEPQNRVPERVPARPRQPPSAADRAATAIRSYFEILAAFTKAFDEGTGCDDKRQRVAAMFTAATKKRDIIVALFRDRDVVTLAGPPMTRPSEDDPSYEVRMRAFGIFIEGHKMSCELEADFFNFLQPIWQAAHEVGWRYDQDQQELLDDEG